MTDLTIFLLMTGDNERVWPAQARMAWLDRAQSSVPSRWMTVNDVLMLLVAMRAETGEVDEIF